MKAVIYARYSSDNQREESIEGQLRECKEYADKNGITILCSYIDRALSAKTDNRPEFQKMVQMRVEKNKRTPARAKAEEEYLLTTKLFCGHCGRMMIGESGKSHTGAIYRYYKCSGAKRKLGCRKKAVKKDWIECIAVQYTIQRVFQDELIAQIADKLVELQNTEDNTLPLLRKQLADTNRGIENMLNAIQQGILTNSTKERLEELEKLREDLKASILQAELERPKYSREDIIEWISRFKYGDPSNKEYQRQIIDIFLNSIYVFDDRLVFTYNYKNGTQTVSLADVSAAFGSDLKSCTPPNESYPNTVFFLKNVFGIVIQK